MPVRVNRASLGNPLYQYNLQVQARVGPPYLRPPYQQLVIPSYAANSEPPRVSRRLFQLSPAAAARSG